MKPVTLQVIPGKSKKINEETNTNEEFSKIPGCKISLQKSNINCPEDKMAEKNSIYDSNYNDKKIKFLVVKSVYIYKICIRKTVKLTWKV